MKFSHSIQFNAVPDWSSHYIAYSNLKKLIYQLEKQENSKPLTNAVDNESSPLLDAEQEDSDKTFSLALDRELEKICSFYQLKEMEIYGELDLILKEEEAAEDDLAQSTELLSNTNVNSSAVLPRPSAQGPGGKFKSFSFGKRRRTSTMSSQGQSDDSDEEDERRALRPTRSVDMGKLDHRPDDYRSEMQSSKRRSSFFEDYNDMSFINDTGMTLKKSIIGIYVSLCELRSFIQLNKTGFTKVLKKYDKTLDHKLKSSYVSQHVTPAYPFLKETMDRLDANIRQVEEIYARLVTSNNIEEARRELRLHLREHVVWERNTVWREMIGIERKGQAANLGIRQTMLGDAGAARLQGDEAHPELKSVMTPVGRYHLPAWLFSPTFYTLLAILGVFFALLYTPIMKEEQQQNCLAMVVFVSLLWATEAIPLFVTSLLVPFLAVLLRVVRTDAKPHRRLDSKAATTYVFASMWTPVIMLLLGGFTIAAALSKYNIAKRMATFVLSKAGTKPRTVLLTSMFVATFASMWISNVAAPVLCFSIVQVSFSPAEICFHD